MIPVRLLLRTFTTNPVLVPAGIRIVRRTQATLAEALPNSIQEPSILSPLIAIREPSSQAGTKKKKGKEISKVEKRRKEITSLEEPKEKKEKQISKAEKKKEKKEKEILEAEEAEEEEREVANPEKKKKRVAKTEKKGEKKGEKKEISKAKKEKKQKEISEAEEGEEEGEKEREVANPEKKKREKRVAKTRERGEKKEILKAEKKEKEKKKEISEAEEEGGGEEEVANSEKKKKKEKRLAKAERKKGGTEPDPPPPGKVVKSPEGTASKKRKKKETVAKVKLSKKLDPPGEPRTEGLKVAKAPTAKAIILRDYQQECIDAVLNHVKQGHKRLAVSLATGSGKTVIFTQLIDKLPPLNDTATQTLILVHRRELLEQALRHCMDAYPEKTVEVEMANKHASGVADITIASIQSIVSKDRVEKFNPRNFKLILIDECHHAVADTYMKTLDHFGALHPERNDGNHPVVVGVSATLSRHDGLRMGTVLDYVAYHKDYLDMIKDNWLSNAKFTTVQTQVDLSAVRETRGDFNLADLSLAVNTPQTNDITVKAWLEKARNRKSTLVFCVDIAHVTALANKFREHGTDARLVTSLTPKEDRSKVLHEFRTGVFPVLVNCGILTEGTDIPNIDCVLLARPTRSRNLLIQMIGRGMRLSPGKEGCHVIDMIGILGRGIISTPTLFGLDPFTIVEDATPEELHEDAMKEEQGPEILRAVGGSDAAEAFQEMPIKNVSFTDYETIWDLLSDTSHEKQIRQLSPNAWVKIGSDYVLSASKMTLRICQQADGKYSVLEKPALKFNPIMQQFMTPPIKTISENVETLAHAVSGADTYAAEHCPRIMLIHSAPWRKMPASEAQIKHLKKVKPDGDWDQRQLTKGQAGDIVTRMKYGMTKLERALKQAKKAKEAEAKLLEIKQKNEITVGKLF